jgi:uncharacterized membrane protein
VKILLINQNATVEKLVKLSAQRIGLELLAAQIAKDENAGEYTWVLVDNESLEGASAADLRAKYRESKIGLLYPKGSNRPEGFDLYIEKPFLPTELIDEFSSVINTPAANVNSVDIESLGGAGDLPPIENLDSLDEVDLHAVEETGAAQAQPPAENLESLDIAGDLPSIDDLPPIDDLDHIDGALPEASPFGEELGNVNPPVAEEMADTLERRDEGDAFLEEGAANEENGEAAAQSPTESLENAESLENIDFTENLPLAEEMVYADGDLQKAATPDGDLDILPDSFDEPKTSVLDSTEVKKVKDILSDDDILDSLTPSESEAEAKDDLKIELGENSALLDEDDLADLRFDSLDEENKDISEDAALDLNAIDDEKPEMPIEDLDLSVINEESIADALGETISKALKGAPVSETGAAAVAGGELHSALSTISIETLREVLDGMHLTINISFSNKK